MIRRPLIALLFSLLAALPAGAQSPAPDSTVGEIVRADLAGAARDVARIATAPLHFSGRDWAVTAGVAGGTAALLLVDRTARAVARRNHSDAADGVFNVGREYGREIYGITAAGGLYAGGLLFGSEYTRTTGRMLFESIVLAGAANVVLKSLIGRSRPQTEEGPYRFRGLQTALEHTSLPSGHATVAFSVSSVLARRLNNPYAAAGFYAMAGVTAVSRVYHDNHWFSDTFLGAAIGTSVGLAVSGGAGDENGSGLSVAPSSSGVSVSYRF